MFVYDSRHKLDNKVVYELHMVPVCMCMLACMDEYVIKANFHRMFLHSCT